MGLSQKFSNPKQCLVMWSSGTGAAGPGGYILNLYVFVYLSKAQKVVLGEVIALAYALLYFYGLRRPRQGQSILRRRPYLSAIPVDFDKTSRT